MTEVGIAGQARNDDWIANHPQTQQNETTPKKESCLVKSNV